MEFIGALARQNKLQKALKTIKLPMRGQKRSSKELSVMNIEGVLENKSSTSSSSMVGDMADVLINKYGREDLADVLGSRYGKEDVRSLKDTFKSGKVKVIKGKRVEEIKSIELIKPT